MRSLLGTRSQLSGCFFIAIFSAVTFILMACGTEHDDSSLKIDELRFSKAMPSLGNFDGWLPLWDEETWIVALKDGLPAAKTHSEFKRYLINSLLAHFDLNGSFDQASSFAALLNDNLEAEVIGVTQFHGAGRLDLGEGLQGFGRVRFKHGVSLWSLLPRSEGESGASLDLRTVAFEQARFLERTPGISWAEPSLENELLERSHANAYKPPAEFDPEGGRYSGGVVSMLKRVKWDVAMQAISDQGKVLKEVVVAVIDTGVDDQHPDLVDRMFQNPGELNKKAGVDDDGNGYYDDIHGIDATIAKGERDTTADRQPGSADLGGAGVACQTDPTGKQKVESCGHGTHVAGIIAASHNSEMATLGLCPSCKILSLRVADRCLMPAVAPKCTLGSDKVCLDLRAKKRCVSVIDKPGPGQYEGNGKLNDVAQIRALTYILNLTAPDNGLYVNVVNMSVGKYYYSRAVSTVIKALRRNEVIVVAAAGNDNTSTPMFPAALSRVLAVCATSTDSGEFSGGRGVFAKTDFSNFGDWVDICAPGAQIVSTYPGKNGSAGNMATLSGTSQATPVVAGAAALMRSAFPEISTEEVLERLKKYADFTSLYKNDGGKNVLYGGEIYTQPYYLLGTGFLDLEAAIKKNRTQSTAFLDQKEGFTSQVSRGCVVQTIGHRQSRASLWEMMSSMPFLLAQAFLVLKLARLVMHGRRKGQKTSAH